MNRRINKMKIMSNMDNTKLFLKEIYVIIKKELTSFFTSPTAYIVMAVFLAILEFLYFTTLLNIKLVYITPLLDNIPWLFLFLIPAITMSSISQESKEGTIEFYLTQPISEIQLLIGKFFSNYIFVIIATLLTLPAVISVASYGDVDWGQIIAQYLGVFAFAFVLTAIGTFMSSIVKSQISAFLLSVLASFVLMVIGLELVTQSLPVFWAQILQRISIYTHYTSLSGGALDLRDIIYFIAVGSLFLIAAYLPLIKNKFHKKEPLYRTLKAIIVLLVAFTISIAILGDQIPGRIDLTQNKLYTLSDTTKKIISETDDVINIVVYKSKQLPSQWQPQSRDIEEMLRDFDTYGKNNVIVTYKYTDNEDNEREALSQGIQPVQFNTQSRDEVSVQKGYLGITISYLGKTEIIEFVNTTEDLEYQLTKRINKLATVTKPTVVFWEGKSLHSVNEDYTIFRQVLEDQFNVTTFSYSEEENKLPENIDTLVLVGPNEEFSQEEKDLITEYIDEGGSILALINPISINMETLSPTVNKNSLSNIFTKYGIRIEDELIYDLRYNEIVSVGGGLTPYLSQYPFWIKAQTNDESSISKGLGLITLRWASPINYDEGEDESIQITPLIYTSQYSSTQKSGEFNIFLDADLSPDSSELFSRNIAISYQNETEDNLIRMVIIADTDILNDESVQGSNSSLLFGLNSMEWLTQSASLSEIRLKNRDLTPIVFEQEWESNLLKYGNIIGIVTVITVVGAVIIIRRTKKSKRKFTE